MRSKLGDFSFFIIKKGLQGGDRIQFIKLNE